MPATPLPDPTSAPAPEVAPIVIEAGGRRYAVHTATAALACCGVESAAAMHLSGEAAGAQPVDGHVLVVSGTVTTRMAPVVERMYAALPEPRHVLSFGVCSNAGGPYWDAYSVLPGVGALIPVDVYVPGCPPRPEALLDGLRQLAEQVAGAAGGSGAGA
ncbi:MAG: NADH-quinone oxidoreductase subunit NuoB [Micrococcales bacterium]|nr:NADH-quinone oxidoreductase subunit NuoB [Micrococcales bacterium]